MPQSGQQPARSREDLEHDLATAVHAARRRLAVANEDSNEDATAELAAALARLTEALYQQEGR
jgi:hypothetical protein